MYLAMTLPSRLIFALLETIKSQCYVIIPQSEYQNCLALTLVQLKFVLTLPLAFPYSCHYSRPLPFSSKLWTLLPNPKPTSEISRPQQKVGAVHKLKPMSRNPPSHFTLVKFPIDPELWTPFELWTPSHPVALPVLCNNPNLSRVWQYVWTPLQMKSTKVLT